MKKKYGILIDTGAGNDLKRFKDTDIHVIPLHIIFEDGTDIKDTQANVEKSNFYKRVRDGENVKTSQASPGELMEFYKKMLEEYEFIIHIPIAKNLSSMYQTATVISNEFPNKIAVIDHSMAANGIAEAAKVLDERIEANPKISVDEIRRFLTDYEKNMYLGIIPGDLKKLDRGGRGSGTLKSMLNLLKIKVLLRWEAEPKKESMSRTISSLVETAAKHVNDYRGERYKAIFVSTPLTDNKILKNAYDVLNKEKIDYEREIIPTLYVAHAGVNTIGLIFVKVYDESF